VDLRAKSHLPVWTTLALHGRIEVFDQCLSVERLTQEARCSGFHVAPGRLPRESRDENDRQLVSFAFAEIMQLDSAHAAS